MGLKTNIAWTDHSWNPWIGCHKTTSGCMHCYMFTEQRRYGRNPNAVIRCKTTFDLPLKIHEPAQIFTCSWSDFFISEADHWRDEAWAIIRKCPHLTFQILTKRPDRIAKCLPADWGQGYPNVWLGVTIESSAYLHRLNILRAIPAAVKFVSAEPLLDNIVPADDYTRNLLGFVDWIIAGCESGDDCRATDIAWARKLKDFCMIMNIPFFLKQLRDSRNKIIEMPELDGKVWDGKPNDEGRMTKDENSIPISEEQ
jgi:protein gp37